MSVVVELRVVVEQALDPVALEQQVAAEGRRGARELYREALRVVDAQATEASGGARQRLAERWVATLFGRMRIWRYRVKGEGRSFHPLDRALGLAQAEPSPGLREALCSEEDSSWNRCSSWGRFPPEVEFAPEFVVV